MNYFIADTHFGGEYILAREHRPFRSAKEFASSVIENFNCQVSDTDTIYHVGDFINYNEWEKTAFWENIHLVKQIKCNSILILGNNEERILSKVFAGNFSYFREFAVSAGFKEVYKELYLTLRTQPFYLNHYPSNHKDEYVNLFGHTHRITGLFKPFGLNVGCDLNHFFLFSEDEIFRLLQQKRDFWEKDKDVLCM